MFDCWAQRFHMTSVSTEDRYVSNISTDYGSFGASESDYPWTRIGYNISSLICASHVLAGAPKAVTDKLQPVLNAAACVVSRTHKYDRGLSRLLHSELHWLHVSELVANELRTCRHDVRLTARPSTTVRDRSLLTSL